MRSRRSNKRAFRFPTSRYATLLLLGALLPHLLAEQAVLHLRNGDRLTGEFLSLSTTNVTITSGALGRISIPLTFVERLERIAPTNNAPIVTNAPPPAPVTNAPTAAAAPANPPPPTAAAVTNAPTGTTAAKPATVAIAPPPPAPPAPKRWTVEVQFGTELQFNQNQRELLYGRFKYTYGLDRFRTVFDYLANYGQNDGVVSANDMTGTFRMEFDLGAAKRLFAFNSVALGYNEIRKIDFFVNESVGMGYKFITQPRFTYTMDLGLNYQHQLLDGGDTKDLTGLRLGEKATWTIDPKGKWFLDQKVDYLPQFSGIENFQARVEVNLRYLLLANLTLNFTAINFYDTQPAPGVSRNDLLLRSSIGVKF